MALPTLYIGQCTQWKARHNITRAIETSLSAQSTSMCLSFSSSSNILVTALQDRDWRTFNMFNWNKIEKKILNKMSVQFESESSVFDCK